MKTIFSSLNLLEVHHLKNLLQSAGIRCRIRNEDLVRLAGEVPFPECALQLVVEREEDHAAAETVLREFLRPQPRAVSPGAAPAAARRSKGSLLPVGSAAALAETLPQRADGR